MKTKPLRRPGKVLAVDGTIAKIELTETCGTACGGCRLAGMCGSGETMTVPASVPSGCSPEPGQKVTIEASESATVTAILLLLCLPLVVLLAAAATLSLCGASDFVTAAGSFVAALLVFGIGWLAGGRRKPAWYIVKSDN